MLSSNIRRLVTTVAFVLPALAIGVPSAQAEDLEFVLHNHSDFTLTEFYVEPVESKTWGDNILMTPLAPGESATVIIADGKTTCMYGIRGEFKDADPVERESLNLCELGSYTYIATAR